MGKLEEIKERAKNEEYVKHDIDYYEAQEDIQYTLSRLEIAEKAITDAKNALDHQYRFNEGIIENNVVYTTLFNALQQIRS